MIEPQDLGCYFHLLGLLKESSFNDLSEEIRCQRLFVGVDHYLGLGFDLSDLTEDHVDVVTERYERADGFSEFCVVRQTRPIFFIRPRLDLPQI